jgi:hypothetical protein
VNDDDILDSVVDPASLWRLTIPRVTVTKTVIRTVKGKKEMMEGARPFEVL